MLSVVSFAPVHPQVFCQFLAAGWGGVGSALLSLAWGRMGWDDFPCGGGSGYPQNEDVIYE